MNDVPYIQLASMILCTLIGDVEHTSQIMVRALGTSGWTIYSFGERTRQKYFVDFLLTVALKSLMSI